MMKRMNRLISIFACAVAMLVWTCAPALAEFKGTLRSDMPVMVEIISDSANAGSAAVVVYYLGRGLEVEAVFSVPAGASFEQECLKPGSRVKRIIIEVDPSVGGNCLLKVSQGALTRFEEPMSNTQVGGGGTNRYVFDLVNP